MWYFTWILGLFAALSAGIINLMWYEARDIYANSKTDADKN
jgi:cyd operon protein YbgT